jgi:hypothetical protein
MLVLQIPIHVSFIVDEYALTDIEEIQDLGTSPQAKN